MVCICYEGWDRTSGTVLPAGVLADFGDGSSGRYFSGFWGQIFLLRYIGVRGGTAFVCMKPNGFGFMPGKADGAGACWKCLIEWGMCLGRPDVVGPCRRCLSEWGRAGEDRTGQIIPERSAGSGAAGCMEEKREYSTNIICIQSGVETFEAIVKIKVKNFKITVDKQYDCRYNNVKS